MTPPFVELSARSAFSLLDGASTPEALAGRAAEAGMAALALTDRFDLGGAVRFHRACREAGVRPIQGAEVLCPDLPPLVLLCASRVGWRHLSALVTRARLANPRGEPALEASELEGRTEGLLCLLRGTPAAPSEALLRRLSALFPGRLWVALEHHGLPREGRRAAGWLEAAAGAGVPWVPANAPRYHRPSRRMVHDVLTCLRHDVTLDEAGDRLLPNGEWYLKSAEQMRARWCGAVGGRGAPSRSRHALDAEPPRGGDASAPAGSPRRRVNGLSREAPPSSGSRPTTRGREKLASRSSSPACGCAGCRALARTAEIAARCTFEVTDLEPRLPSFPVPGGGSSSAFLRELVDRGAAERYGEDFGPRHRRQARHELEVIGRLGLADYFLITWDVVRFAQRKGILVQGRGSAANSVVCYCLGITAVDPVGRDLLFERFLSEERGGAPDIDLDIAHDDREEVLQYVYRRWGRDHAAMVCETITYRGRMAVRDAARVLGFPTGIADRLSAEVERGEAGEAARRLADGGAAAAGLDPADRRTRALIRVVRGMDRLPRHRSIHVGGFVLSGPPVGELCPVEEASMEGRTIVQWDKDDLSELGIVKFDLLGLGMLTVLGRALRHVREARGVRLDLSELPAEDEATYDMLCEADTVGVFQVESRAQMATLPRVRPRCFYDLAVEVALIRPGPIQGDMVHPYLRRRRGDEPVTYLDERLKPVLERTLGVPLFQEQGMKVAVELAGFTPAQADRLRRAMGFKRSERAMEEVGRELEEGLKENGVPAEARRKIFGQLTAFANYGFPESHALSFALLVYASAYLKRHYAPEFTCALLNAQPMGFYAPSTLVEDARRHGVEVRPVDLARSAWDCSLEEGPPAEERPGEGAETPQPRSGEEAPPPKPAVSETGGPSSPAAVRRRGGSGARACRSRDGDSSPALRLGLRMVRGLGKRAREELERARQEGPFTSVRDVVRRSGLGQAELRTLAEAGAFRTLWPGRREALWELLRELRGDAGPLAPRPRRGEAGGGGGTPENGGGGPAPGEPGGGARGGPAPPSPPPDRDTGLLPPMSRFQRVLADYRTTGVSVEGHPMEFLRDALDRRGVLTAEALREAPAGREVTAAGLAIVRQRPSTAKGVIFVTLEDETGFANGVVMPDVREEHRRELRAPVLLLEGEVEREAGVVNVLVRRVRGLGADGRLVVRDRSFR